MRQKTWFLLLEGTFVPVVVARVMPTTVQTQTQSTVSIDAGGSATGSTYTNTATIDLSQITSTQGELQVCN